MASTGFSNKIRVRNRRGGRLEPRGGWRLGVKTAAPPPGAGSDDPAESAEERAARERADRLRARRLSDSLVRKDERDSALDADHTPPGMPLVRRFRQGNEPRTAHHGDPVEDVRTAAKKSTSVWVQDNRPEHLKAEAREDEPALRRGFEGDAAVRELSSAVLGGMQRLVTVRWSVLTDRARASDAEVAYQAAKRRQADDGRVPSLTHYSELAKQHREVVPPLAPSLLEVDADPALLHLARGEYPGAEHEPPILRPGDDERGIDAELDPVRLPGDEHSRLVQADALGVIASACDRLEQRHLDRCLVDPDAAEAAEARWAADRERLTARVGAEAAFPEESRVLVGALRSYADDMGPVWDEARYVGRVTAALGRHPLDDPLDADTLDVVRTQYPAVPAGVAVAQLPSEMYVAEDGRIDPDRALLAARLHAAVGADPAASPFDDAALDRALAAGPELRNALAVADADSPLVVAPAGVDDYDTRLEAAADRALLVPPSQRGPESVVDFQLEVVDACSAQSPARATARSAPSPPVQPAPQALATERLTDFLEVCADYRVEVAVEGTDRAAEADVVLPADSFASERVLVDGAWRDEVSVRSDVDAAVALPPALSQVAERLYVSTGVDGEPSERACEAFALRVASRVLEQPLDDALLGDRGQGSRASVLLMTEVGHGAARLERREEQRLAARWTATERFEKMLDECESRGVVVDNPPADAVPAGRPSFERRDDGLAVVHVNDPALLRSFHAPLPDADLAALHADAYVAMGRASGSFARPGAPRSADYNKAYPPGAGPVGSEGVAVAVVPAPSRAQLREQIVADAFATEQLSEGWSGQYAPERAAVKVEKGHLELRGDYSDAVRAELAESAKACRRGANTAGSQLERGLKQDDVPSPAAAPAPAAGAAREVVEQRSIPPR